MKETDLAMLRRVCTIAYEGPGDTSAEQIQHDLCQSPLGSEFWLQLPLILAELEGLRDERRQLRKFAHHHVVCLRMQRRFRQWTPTSEALLSELCDLLGGYGDDGRRFGKGRGGRERKQESVG